MGPNGRAMHQAEYQPANLVPAQVAAGATAGRSFQAMRHRLARAVGLGLQRRGPNPQVDLLGLTRAMLASIVQSTAATIQAGGERHHLKDSNLQLSRFRGGRCRSQRYRSVAPLSPNSTFAARLADLQRRSDATDKAAAITLQELKAQGQQVAAAMDRQSSPSGQSSGVRLARPRPRPKPQLIAARSRQRLGQCALRPY